MARKPRSEWSPAYRRRIEAAEARGLSRSQARGHKESSEYQHRLEKEREEHGYAAVDLRIYERWAERHPAIADPEEFADWMAFKGRDFFNRYRAVQTRLSREYHANKSGWKTREGYIEEIMYEEDLLDIPESWLFYKDINPS